MVQSTKRRMSVWGSLLATGVAVQPVWAQTQQGQAPEQSLADVVVSASRAEQRSFDAPASIQSVGREEIESGGPQVNLSESLKRVPGLTILNRQNYAQDLQLSIRGFGSRASFGIRGIRLIIDGIPATTPDGQAQGSSVSLTSTDRIEVLRGPLAQLYGNAAGGVVQAFTREAPENPEFNAQLYTGSYGLRRSDWQYAGKIGNVGLVADYSTFNIDGYRKNSETERKQFNGKLDFALAPATQMKVVLNQFDMPLALDPLGLSAAQLARDPRAEGTGTSGPASSYGVRKSVLQTQIGTVVTQRIDSAQSLTARTYYGTRENLQYQAGTTSTPANGTWVGLERQYVGFGLLYNLRTQVNQIPVIWAAGYDFDQSRERRQGGDTKKGEKDVGLTRDELNTARNSDFFVQANAMLSEHVSTVIGARQSSVQFSSNDYFPVTASNPDGSGARSFSAINPVVGLTFHATPTLNLYANYGRGFETPTLSEVAYKSNTSFDPNLSSPNPNANPTLARFNPSLNASSSQHREIGAKWIPVLGSRFDLAAYQIDSRDEIVVEASSSGRTTYVNAPGTQRTGLEAAASTLFTPQTRFSLSANFIDATYSQDFSSRAYAFQSGTFIPNTKTIKSGYKLSGIPKNFVFSELLWSSIPLDSSRPPSRSGSLAGGSGMRLGLELIHAGKIYADDNNLQPDSSAPGYTLLSAVASQGWSIGRAQLTAYARIENLTDKNYVGSVIVNQSSQKYFEPGAARNWIAGLRLNLPL